MIQREQWHLTEGLIFAHFAVFILSTMMQGSQQALALIPGLVSTRPWTLVTYQFIHGSSMFWFFISMLVLWIMAKPLEDSWGSPRFLVFWMVATFGASVTAALIGRPLFGDLGFSSCLLFTFATLYPEVEFRLFFIIPVKVKYLAFVAAAILVYSSLSMGLVDGLANIAGTSAGYLFFLATRRLPTRRKIAFEFSKRKANIAIRAENTQAADRNQAWDPLVRAADARAREVGAVAPEDEPLLAELDAAKDPTITVCAPSEFGFIDDPVCRGCNGFAECAARRIRMAAEHDQSKGN
ncbi:MAG: rhomboid family intramembrane serine protease [Thermoanaerobaculales bacterium]|nr:rhomboid family intramembrane serine protease [Thermoanaerobaculales bacterium]